MDEAADLLGGAASGPGSVPTPPDARALLVTGVYGAGKSTVTAELVDRLDAAGVPVAGIDLDWLGWYGAPVAWDEHEDPRMTLRNLAAMRDAYLEVGVRTFVLAGAAREARARRAAARRAADAAGGRAAGGRARTSCGGASRATRSPRAPTTSRSRCAISTHRRPTTAPGRSTARGPPRTSRRRSSIGWAGPPLHDTGWHVRGRRCRHVPRPTIHPLVLQLRFTRREFLRGLRGVNDDDGAVRLGPMNCIAWNVGHLAWQEQRYFVSIGQERTPYPEVAAAYEYGAPGSTPRLRDTLAAWKAITAEADPWLDTLTIGAPRRDPDPARQAPRHHVRQPAPADDLPLLVPHGREPGHPPDAGPRAGCRSSWAASTPRRRTVPEPQGRALRQPPETAGMTWTRRPGRTAASSAARSPSTNTLRWVRIDGPASRTRFASPGTCAVEVADHLEDRRAARLHPALRARGTARPASAAG